MPLLTNQDIAKDTRGFHLLAILPHTPALRAEVKMRFSKCFFLADFVPNPKKWPKRWAIFGFPKKIFALCCHWKIFIHWLEILVDPPPLSYRAFGHSKKKFAALGGFWFPMKATCSLFCFTFYQEWDTNERPWPRVISNTLAICSVTLFIAEVIYLLCRIPRGLQRAQRGLKQPASKIPLGGWTPAVT